MTKKSTATTFSEHLARVEMMADDEGGTWDLSDNDIAALKSVLLDRRRLASMLNTSRDKLRELSAKWRKAEAWQTYGPSPQECADELDATHHRLGDQSHDSLRQQVVALTDQNERLREEVVVTKYRLTSQVQAQLSRADAAESELTSLHEAYEKMKAPHIRRIDVPPAIKVAVNERIAQELGDTHTSQEVETVGDGVLMDVGQVAEGDDVICPNCGHCFETEPRDQVNR